MNDKILLEIDSTLERLIKNAQTFQNADLSDLTEAELDAFQKTQESLLHHLLRMDQLYEEKRKMIDNQATVDRIQKKYDQFEKLKKSTRCTLDQTEQKIPIMGKRKNKRLILDQLP